MSPTQNWISGEGLHSGVLAEVTRQLHLTHQAGDSVEVDNRMVARRADVTESTIDRVALIEAVRAGRSVKPLDRTPAQLNNIRGIPAHLNTILRRHRRLICRHQRVEAIAHVVEKTSCRG